eukprot:TRINITY_DN16745_c0_g1_i1.p1 TRINITY_DN16745_c0_g1~~TRINITY_DN16745_c0_g1_i1.p1  ORF type:complete len:107 (-),score=30.22 TRINITY_DN16745_c0_g1_i1:424-744(-)
MASTQEGAAQQAALHAFFEQQANGAAQAAAKAPSDQVVTHPLGQTSQEEKEELVQEQQEEMHAFFEKQSQTAAAAAAHAPSDQEVTHSLDPEVMAAPEEVTEADFH